MKFMCRVTDSMVRHEGFWADGTSILVMINSSIDEYPIFKYVLVKIVC